MGVFLFKAFFFLSSLALVVIVLTKSGEGFLPMVWVTFCTCVLLTVLDYKSERVGKAISISFVGIILGKLFPDAVFYNEKWMNVGDDLKMELEVVREFIFLSCAGAAGGLFATHANISVKEAAIDSKECLGSGNSRKEFPETVGGLDKKIADISLGIKSNDRITASIIMSLIIALAVSVYT